MDKTEAKNRHITDMCRGEISRSWAKTERPDPRKARLSTLSKLHKLADRPLENPADADQLVFVPRIPINATEARDMLLFLQEDADGAMYAGYIADELTKETIIIVHGTWAAPEADKRRWYQRPDGTLVDGFVSKLNAALRKHGSRARCWAHCTHGSQIFVWSGKNSWIARTNAAAALGAYVNNLLDQGWCCHIIAHSHGGNVVCEALPEILSASSSWRGSTEPDVSISRHPGLSDWLHREAHNGTVRGTLGKIVTLGTPFMDTRTPVAKRASSQKYVLALPGRSFLLVARLLFGMIFLMIFLAIVAAPLLAVLIVMLIWWTTETIMRLGLRRSISTEGSTSMTVSMGNKGSKPTTAKTGPKFLAIGSVMDEPWQLLHHSQMIKNPMAIQANLLTYLIRSVRAHIMRSIQVARIHGAASYRDLRTTARISLLSSYVALGVASVYTANQTQPFGLSSMITAQLFTVGAVFSAVLLLTGMFGSSSFFSAFMYPFRFCGYCVKAAGGLFNETLTYVVRSRGWSVILAIAMGLEAYRYKLPNVEQFPKYIPDVKYEKHAA